MGSTSTYRPLPGDRVYTIEHIAGTICGEHQVHGIVLSVQPNMADIKWDDGLECGETLTDQAIYPELKEHYVEGSYIP